MSTATATKPTRQRKAPPSKNKGGRPPLVPDGHRVQLNTRTQEETRDRLKVEADRRGVSVSFMVERALQEGLKRWEAEDLSYL